MNEVIPNLHIAQNKQILVKNSFEFVYTAFEIFYTIEHYQNKSSPCKEICLKYPLKLVSKSFFF